jgi:predicted secreted acid phosphatase
MLPRMKRLPAFLLALALVGCATSHEPRPNLTLLEWRCIAWHDSGDYDRAFARAARPAMRVLDHYLRGETPRNYAIVFDIDETLLSNWAYLRATGFDLQPATFAKFIATEHAVALAPTREIFAKAHAYRIPIFLVTGRSESMRAATRRDLEQAGYWGWSGLFMKPDTYRDGSVVPFKSGVRKMLTEQGYDIILNLGDQKSDLAGGYARRRVKLPNPFYYIP